MRVSQRRCEVAPGTLVLPSDAGMVGARGMASASCSVAAAVLVLAHDETVQRARGMATSSSIE